MFGKAVKIRHCPATVSAPTLPAVDSIMARQWNPARCHWELFFSKSPGKAVRKGASQETGPLVPTHLAYVPRGTEDTDVFSFWPFRPAFTFSHS
jgi:hypothetical protein